MRGTVRAEWPLERDLSLPDPGSRMRRPRFGTTAALEYSCPPATLSAPPLPPLQSASPSVTKQAWLRQAHAISPPGGAWPRHICEIQAHSGVALENFNPVEEVARGIDFKAARRNAIDLDCELAGSRPTRIEQPHSSRNEG